MTRPRIIHFLLFAIASLPAAVCQEEGPPPRAEVEIGDSITTQYFYRGWLEEDQGLILQPYLEGSLLITDGEGNLSNIRLNAGWWNSLHTGPTGTDGMNSDPELWFESRINGGLEATVMEALRVAAELSVSFSPNDSFGTHYDLDFLFELDDSELWGSDSTVFGGLNPHALVSIEIAGDRHPYLHEKGAYLELGLEPSVEVIRSGEEAVTVSVPVTLGTNLSKYYEDPVSGGEDDFIGFLDMGIDVTAPASLLVRPFVIGNPGLENWELHAGVHWLHLGDSTKKLNNGDSEELIIKVGGSVHF